MAAKPIGMLQVRRILQLLHNGVSKKRTIARDLDLSRNTVKNYLHIIQHTAMVYADLLALDDAALGVVIHEPARLIQSGDKRYQALQEFMPVIEQELKKTGVTRELLWQEYRMEQPAGYGYTQFCHYISEYFVRKDLTMHFVHKPGEKMLVDFAGKTISYLNEEDKEVKCQVFVAILPYSGYTYTEAVHSQKQGDFVRCLENAMKYFGGVPQCIISDNLASCIKRADRYEPELTELLEQFSVHYNTTVTATRVAKPKDKASVEKAVHLAYQRIYAPIRNQSITSLARLNAAIAIQTELHHSRKFRQSAETTRQVLFDADEKHLLRALPAATIEISNATTAKVQRNYHIVLGQDWHYYSVPYQYVGKEVKIIYTHATVEIYYEYQRIALHKRNMYKNHYSTQKEHMPESHLHYAQIKGWDAPYFRTKALALSPDIAQAIEEVLQSRFFYEQTFNACLGILRLADKYTVPRLSIACALAVKAKAVSYRFISNILKNNMDQRNQAAPVETQTIIDFHENIRGPQAYK
jgi:transposase